jgi:hypothetical protein
LIIHDKNIPNSNKKVKVKANRIWLTGSVLGVKKADAIKLAKMA